MGKKFTDAQLSAIQDRGNNLLVSAAAGSGKTTVLIERIIRRITDPNDNINIDDLLVVTYTKSAAAEIREKLSRALSEKLSENPSNRKLIRQLAMLGNAHINTIDAFFLDVIKENSEKLGLLQNVSPCDEATSQMLMEKACGEVLEEKYSCEKENSPFFSFIENFSDMRSDNNVAEFIINLYEALRNFPEPFEYLKNAISEYDFVACGGDYMESVWGKKLTNEIAELSAGMVNACESVLDVIESDDGLNGKYNASIENIKNFFASLEIAVKSGKYANVRNVVNDYSPVSFGPAKNADPFAKKYAANFREKANDEIKGIKLLLSQSPDEIAEIAKKSAELLTTAYDILKKFDSVYSAKKKQLGVIDFADMPKNCFSLLFEKKDGKLVPSELAKSSVGSFKELYIDEYQDTNVIRDMIFEAVSKVSGATRFMVGDVKQCIYAFINSRPDLFMKYYDSFANSIDSKRIILSENFRSDLSIIKTVNSVFSPIMTRQCGGVDYDKNAELVHKKENGGDEDAELMILLADENEKIASLRKMQAKMIANKIAELINDGEYNPSDIAILTRKNSETDAYVKALAEAGIKVSAGKQNFFELPEIKLLLSVLSAIDNPNSDVPLFASMCGPIFGFTLSELARLSLERSGSLWESVCEHSENNAKLTDFVNKINAYRSYSLSFGIDKLIVRICRESGFERAVKSKKDGKKRYDAILKLCEYAREYSSEDYRGIGNFLSYMEKLEKSGKTDKDASSADGVTVCTVHNSKGLEYEVCFAANLERELRGNNSPGLLHIASELPPAFHIKHFSGFATVNSPMCNAAEYFDKNDPISEEMRILYVELTRAKKKLYMTAAVSENKLTDMLESFNAEKDICSPFAIMHSKTCSEWIMRALCKNFSVQKVNSAIFGSSALCDFLSVSSTKPEDLENTVTVCEKAEEKSIGNVDSEYVYAHSDRTKIPAKLSVSELSDDEDAAVYVKASEISASPAPIRPEFMSSLSASSAEKGIAMHQFMQFCNFENAEGSIAKEADRLAENGFITAKQRELLDEKLLAKFFESGLYAKIKNSESVYREFRYNLCDDSSEYYDVMGEKVLVQGVIDCFFENKDGNIILLDFKTDRVPFENGAEILKERHSPQLAYYRKAIEKILEKKVSNTYIYSFCLSRAIEI